MGISNLSSNSNNSNNSEPNFPKMDRDGFDNSQESTHNSTIQPPHKFFDTITFGVGSDHFQRKSKYGLLKYVIDQKPNCSIFEVDRFSPNMLQYFKLSDLLQKLKQKKNLFDNRIISPIDEKSSTITLLKSI